MSATVYTKSFQNCSETDVPGYNDCPSFLLSTRNKKSSLSSHKIVDNVPEYMYGKRIVSNNITPPPPPFKRKISRRVSSDSDFSVSSVESDKSNLEKHEIVDLVNNLLNSESRLTEKEFQFYKRKIEANFVSSLEHESARSILSQFFTEAEKDKPRAQKLMKNWLVSDITVSNWVPSFIKIFENSI